MAKQSLASREPGLTTLPETGPITVVRPLGEQTPYVVFAHPMSRVLWPKLSQAIAGLDEGDTVLVLPEPQRPVKLSPMRFMLLAAFQYWGRVTDTGELTAARTEPPTEDKREWKEQIESVLLVFAENRIIPAGMLWKTTKCGGVHRAIDALKLAANLEEWGKQSADHKLTLAVPVVWGRFVAQTKLAGAKTAKGSGYTYRPATSLIFPTTAAEMKLLSDSFADDGFSAAMNAVQKRYEFRVSEVTSMTK
jgi:hypothetical protein